VTPTADELRQLLAKHGEHAPEVVLWRTWEALPSLLDELDRREWNAGRNSEAVTWLGEANDLLLEIRRERDELREAVRVYLEIHGRRLKWVAADGNGTWSDMFGEEQEQIARLRALIPETEETPK
jgi:hypothetical protein